MSNKKLYFPEFLKKFRKEMNMSIREIAKIWEISPSYVFSLENGERKINIDLINSLIEKFNLDLNVKEELYKICNHDNPYIEKEISRTHTQYKFPSFLSQYMDKSKLTCRKLASILLISPAYVCALKNGNSKITFKVLNLMIKKLKFTDEEKEELYHIYDLDNGLIPSSIVNYLLENKLIDDMLNILKNDKTGKSIKSISASFKSNR